MKSATKIWDNALQISNDGPLVYRGFTHGTRAQRQRSFEGG